MTAFNFPVLPSQLSRVARFMGNIVYSYPGLSQGVNPQGDQNNFKNRVGQVNRQNHLTGDIDDVDSSQAQRSASTERPST